MPRRHNPGALHAYVHKGDVFMRGLSPVPPVYTTVARHDTGRRYVRRIRANTAPGITVSAITELLNQQGKPKEKLDTLVFYCGRVDGKPKMDNRHWSGYDVALRFTKTAQHIGFRYWFVCPRCHARRSKLYAVPLEGRDVWGCRSCLGLSYPSQYGHKTLWHDNKAVGRDGPGIRGWTPCEPAKTTPEVKLRAHKRLLRRNERFFGVLSRLLEHSE